MSYTLTLVASPPQTPHRNTGTHCQICAQQFSLLTREHLCKRCFRFVCDTCSPFKQGIFKANMLVKRHRLCRKCSTQSEVLKQYVENNRLCWGTDSDVGRGWVKAIKDVDFGTKTKKAKRIQFQVEISQLWKSFNYSFRELICRSINNNKSFEPVTQKSCKQEIPQAYKTITLQCLQALADTSYLYPSQSPSSILYIIIFFLIHCNPKNAVLLTKYICNFVVQKSLSTKNIYQYLKILNFSDFEAIKLQSFFSLYGEKLVKSVTINYVSVEMSIEIISIIIKGKWGFQELQQVLVYSVSPRKEFALANSTQPQAILVDIMRNYSGLGDGFKNFIKHFQNSTTDDHKKVNSRKRSTISRNQSEQNIIPYDELMKEFQKLQIKHMKKQKQFQKLVNQNLKLSLELANVNQQRDASLKSKGENEGKGDDIIVKEDEGSTGSFEDERESGNRKGSFEKRKIKNLIKSKGATQEINFFCPTSSSRKNSTDKNSENIANKPSTQNSQQQSSENLNQSCNNQQNYVSLTFSLESSQNSQTENELQKLSRRLQGYEQMNRKLVQKIKQLTNMLMDRDEQCPLSNEEMQALHSSNFGLKKEANGQKQCRIF